MDLSQATNKQLYAIAIDESNRLRIRYAAAKELQERRKKRVQMRISRMQS